MGGEYFQNMNYLTQTDVLYFWELNAQRRRDKLIMIFYILSSRLK